MNLFGKKLLLSYESGFQVMGHYTSSTVSWEVRAGAESGSKGTENITVAEVAPNIFFVCWVEASGTTVSQVLDLDHAVVTGFVTFDTPEGRQGMFNRGTLTEQE